MPKKKKKKEGIKAFNFFTIIVGIIFCGAIARLGYVTLNEEVDGTNLQAKSASITTASRTLYASRGSIFDINGDTLASTVNSYTLIAYLSPSRTTDPNNPRHVVDKEMTAAKLATVLDLPQEKILEYLSAEGKYQVEFGPKGKDLTELDRKNIENLDLPGIDFITSTKRYYDMSTFASYIVGYAKKNENGEINGELGIESYYNDVLAGTNGFTKFQKYTSSNYQIPNTPSETVEAKNGSDIYLTIDSNIQLIAEKAVSKYTNYNVDWAIFTVMDAKTGAIIASATNPNFNPNDTNTITSYMNPLVSYQYEPGSVMKIFSFASSINEGKYDGNATYESGHIEVADAVIRDANRKGWGTITFDTGFAYSSNVAATTLALELGISTLTDYYDALGFGKKTGIELSNEVVGDIDFTYKTELATASFGQGITVTPIQMLQALSTMTNNGDMIKPYVVEKIVDDDGNIEYEGKRKVVRNVFKPETVTKMHELMHKVVYESLTKIWQVPNVSVMGKTGTAQMSAGNGSYSDEEYDYIKSFAAIFPEDNPRYVVYAAAQRVHGTPKEFAEPITTAIEEIASYAKVTDNDTQETESKIYTVDNYISKDVEQVKASLQSQNINVITIGNGKYVIDEYPKKGRTILSNGKLFLLTNSTEYLLPNMLGWGQNDVKIYCDLTNITCNFNNYGYVLSQSIPENTLINKDTILDLNLGV